MSTITKEQAKDLRNAFGCWKQDHDPVEDKEQYDMFGLGIVAMDALLASLEAEPVAYLYSASFERGHVEGELTDAPGCDMPVYSAPPAPVSVPDEWNKSLQEMVGAMRRYEMDVDEDAPYKHRAMMRRAEELLEKRAAMLQGADDEVGSWHNDKNTPASHTCDEHIRYESNAGGNLWIQCSRQKYERMKAAGMLTRVLYERPKNAPENIPTLRDGLAAIRSSGLAIDAEKIFAERDALNSPVIPDGWVMVPVEPTENMVVEGFESEPDEFFSDAEVWEAYDAMSGCQQAAHRAKLCWSAMIAAVPKKNANSV